MTAAQINKFLSAAEAADIKGYSFFDDIQTRMVNGERSIVIFDEGNDALVCIRPTIQNGIQGKDNAITTIVEDIADVRRAEIYGNYESMKKFLEEYGVTLTNDQIEIILKIDRNNLVVNAMTGDYTNIFHKLSQAEYDALTPEEKAEYDEHVRKEEERYALPKGVSAQITI